MKVSQRLRTASFHRVLDFTEENPLTPANAIATALITQLNNTTTALGGQAVAQDLAFGTVHGAIVDRRLVKQDLVSALKDLGETARALDPAEHPGLAAEMRLGRTGGNYGALLVRARAIHSALVPVKEAFVEYGSPATVDADLMALITAFEAATQRKNDGRAGHVGGTAGIEAHCKSGVIIVRKLDAIFSKVFKSDPVKFAAWKAARRVERNPVPAPAEPESGGSGTTTATS
jgi:hypothetical protein